jgi:hypothetical protein
MYRNYITLSVVFTELVNAIFTSEGRISFWNKVELQTVHFKNGRSSGQFLATDPEVPDSSPGPTRFSEK